MEEVLSRNGTVIVTESEINSSKTMEGDLIHIEDAAPINVEECVTTLEPIQAGSEDPSPENVRPITGYTGINLTRTGKNLLPVTSSNGTIQGVTFTVNKDSAGNVVSVTANGTATNLSILRIGTYTLKAGTYILTGCPNGGSTATFYLDWRTDSSTQLVDIGNGSTYRSEGQNGYSQIVIRPGTTCNNLVFKPMIRLASDTDPTFEPYQGETHTTTFPSTVYSVEHDWTNGVLTSKMASVDLGTLNYWYVTNSGVSPYFACNISDAAQPLNIGATIPNIKCSQYKVTARNSTSFVDKCITLDWTGSVAQVQIKDLSYTDVTAFKASMQGVQLVYELATPIEIPLTPEVITLLKGENNIYTDSGTNTLTYQPDNIVGELKGEIQLLQSQINTLINQLNSLS